jgi:flagellin
MRAQGAYASFSRQLNATLERLATGKQINRAADNPAGLAAVNHKKADLAVMNKRIERLDFQDAYLGAREGAESVLSDLLLDLQSAVTRSANTGALTPAEKEGLQVEADSIIRAIDHLAQTTTFNGSQILAAFNSSNLGVSHADPDAPTSLRDMLGSGELNLVSGDLEAAQAAVTSASEMITASRGAIGRQMQANESERRLLMSEIESTELARSHLEDADFAKETANLIREQTLQEASLFIMQFAAEQKQEMVKSLLDGVKAER